MTNQVTVTYSGADEALAGLEIESASAFFHEDKLVIMGELVSASGGVIEGYCEIQAVVYDFGGQLVGQALANWAPFGLRQSFSVALFMGDDLFGDPATVALVPVSDASPVDRPEADLAEIAVFRSGTPNAGRVLQHDGQRFVVSGYEIPLVHVLQYDRSGDLEWRNDAWGSWAQAQRDSGLPAEHPLHELGATTLDQLSGIQFEQLCALYFTKQGYAVEMTPAVADGGVDLVLCRLDERVLVQCKRHARPVGEPVVRDLYGVVLHHGADSGVVCASAGFTPAARAWVGDKPLVLIEGQEILRGLA